MWVCVGLGGAGESRDVAVVGDGVKLEVFVSQKM